MAYGGLWAAGAMEKVLGNNDLGTKLFARANQVQQAVINYLWIPTSGTLSVYLHPSLYLDLSNNQSSNLSIYSRLSQYLDLENKYMKC